MATSDDQTGTKPPENPTVSILQMLHAASLTRWSDRREHEWKINYAFWAAMIGSIAILATKHMGLTTPDYVAAWTLFGTGVITIVVQLIYLIRVTSRGIMEIEMQTDIEEAMWDHLDERAQKRIKIENFGAGMRGRSDWDKRYGMYVPIAITAMLLLVAGILLLHPLKQFESESSQTNVHPCSGQR